jgi:xyloglucan-specific exo-beta-1,4-glucanase
MSRSAKALSASSARVGVLLALGAILSLLIVSQYSPILADESRDAYRFRNVVIGGGGGFIPGIIFNTTEPNIAYLRTDIGGAYRWDQKDSRWIQLLNWIGIDDWNLTGVESIASDPVDPDRVYLAVGTYTNEWTSQNGAILRSDDRGRSWRRFNLPFKVGGNMPGRGMGERLAIDPNNHRILYLGTRSGNGLWRSTDYGETWSQVTSFPDTGPYHEPSGGPSDTYDNDPIGVVWVTFDPRATVGSRHDKVSQNIYVGVADPASSLFHSTDGGQTWSAVVGQPTGVMPHHGKLASTGILYLSYNNNAGPYDGSAGDVWKYDTGSAVWTKITPPASPLNGGYGFGGLAVDALNPNTIVVATLNQWWPDTNFFRSLDGGATWSLFWDVSWTNPAGWPPYLAPNYTLSYASIAPWLTFGAAPATCTAGGTSNSLCPQPTPKLGWMVESLEIDPFNSDHMLYGTGATLFGTDNLTAWGTSNPVQISVKAIGVEETAVLDLISPPAGAHLLSGVGDIGGFKHDDLTLPSVMAVNPEIGSTTSLDFAELNPSFIVRVGNGNGGGQNIGFSSDGGTTWAPAGTAPSGAGGGTVATASDGSRVLWNPGGQGVYFSLDYGTTWTASAGVPSGGRVGSDRVNPLKFYDFVNGTLYVSIDGGATFLASGASGLPPAGTSGRFKAVPGKEGDIWLAGGSDSSGVYGLWHSTDSGASFNKLPHVEKADNIGFGMPAPHHKYVALYSSAQVHGERGVYRSDDGGWSWTRVTDDEHQFASTGGAITGDPRVYGRVYLSTNGLGIIYGDLRECDNDHDNHHDNDHDNDRW